MANKPIHSIKFPGLEDTYTFVQADATLSQQGDAADAAATGNRFNTIESSVANLERDIEARPTAVSVIPIYQGDWISEKLPSACLKISNMVYLFDGLSSTEQLESNVSQVHIYNYSTNSFVETKDIVSGHANSVAYDGSNIWIAPVFDYTLPTSDSRMVNYVIKYTSDFQSYETVTAPYSIMSISYDWKAQKLYALGYNRIIYEYDGTDFVAVSTAVHIDTNAHFNQDFAVNNGRAYISTPAGLVASFLIESTPTIDSWYVISQSDQCSRFEMDEIQGFEFDQYGTLYCAKSTDIGNGYYNGFFTILPIGSVDKITSDSTLSYSEAHFTYDLITTKPLQLMAYQISHLNQLHAIFDKPTRINIAESASLGRVTISDTLRIEWAKDIVFESLNVQSGVLSLAPTESTNSLTIGSGASAVIDVGRAGTLVLAGGNQIHVLNDKLSINIGYSFPTTKIRVLPDKPIYIGGVLATKSGTYIGNGSNHVYTEDNIRAGAIQVTASPNKVIKVTYTFENPMTTSDYDVMLTMRTTTSGYADMASMHYWLYSTSTTAFSFILDTRGAEATRYPVFRFVAVNLNDSGTSTSEVLQTITP